MVAEQLTTYWQKLPLTFLQLSYLYFSFDQFLIGDGNNVYDFTYVENVAHAHICAERALASEGPVSEKAAGEVPLRFCYSLVSSVYLCS